MTPPTPSWQETRQARFTVSTDPERLNVDVIHDFLSRQSYWHRGIPRHLVERAIKNALCFGVYDETRQVGFARVITDYATYAYVDDVFILPSHRGMGLSKWLMQCVMKHPDLQGLRRWSLTTRDAHGLYRQVGFTAPAEPEEYMEIVHHSLYQDSVPTPEPAQGAR